MAEALRRRAMPLLRLTWPERLMLAQTALLLPSLRLLLRAAGLRRVHALLARTAAGEPRSPRWMADDAAETATRIVDMAARHSPAANTCLHRSLALWWLLRRRGVGCDLRLGARRHEGVFDAHAWVECGGIVLNDDADRVREYAPLAWTAVDRLP